MRYCDCLLHHHLGRGNTQHLLVGIRTPGSGHRQMLMEPPLKAHPGSHLPPSNAVQGEESLQGNGGRVETPPGIIFDGTTSEKSADGAEMPNGGHPRDSRWKSTASIGLAPEPTPGKRERAHRLRGGAVSNSTWVGGKIDAASKKGSGTRRCHRRRQDQRNASHRISLAVSRVHRHHQTCR